MVEQNKQTNNWRMNASIKMQLSFKLDKTCAMHSNPFSISHLRREARKNKTHKHTNNLYQNNHSQCFVVVVLWPISHCSKIKKKFQQNQRTKFRLMHEYVPFIVYSLHLQLNKFLLDLSNNQQMLRCKMTSRIRRKLSRLLVSLHSYPMSVCLAHVWLGN